MDTLLVPHLLIYGALLVGAATLGYWPELRRVTHALRDLAVVDKVRCSFTRLHQRLGGRVS